MRALWPAVIIGCSALYAVPKWIASRGKAAPPAITADHSASGWQYNEKRDEMRGTTQSFASLPSTNTVDLSFPYNRRANRMWLNFVRGADDRVMMALRVDEGQFECGPHGCSIAVKFDDGPVDAIWLYDPGHGDTTVLGMPDDGSFLARVSNSRTLTVEAEFFRDGRKQMTFATRGLVWK